MSPSFIQQYTTQDKSDWGDGPWQSEPDKLVWIDAATDLDCMMVRNKLGAWCGYIGIPPTHPWHGRKDVDLDVHGGLTFYSMCHDNGDESRDICHIAQPGRPEAVWWLGFDCAHSFDIAPAMLAREREWGLSPSIYEDALVEYRDTAYVIQVIEDGARQVMENA